MEFVVQSVTVPTRDVMVQSGIVPIVEEILENVPDAEATILTEKTVFGIATIARERSAHRSVVSNRR